MNSHIFNNERRDLLEKIAKNPERFVGIYRATTPLPKLQQFLSQSREIRFGDGMEEVIKNILAEIGYFNLYNQLQDNNGETLDIDQYFHDADNNYYFIEQKIRDDHDSTKKRGQIDNFRKKYNLLTTIHGRVIGIMYFIDSNLTKNRNYYATELNTFPQGTVKLFYGEEFFNWLNRIDLYYELENNLRTWRSRINSTLNLNFDDTPLHTFNEIYNLSFTTWRKLIENDTLWNEGIISTLFPTGDTLVLILNYFRQCNEIGLASELKGKIFNYYGVNV